MNITNITVTKTAEEKTETQREIGLEDKMGGA